MSMSLKAETSIEFMFFIGILMVFFVFFVGIVGLNNRDIDESTVFTSAGNVLNTAVNEINTASRTDGYYREFYLPEKLSSGESYNLTIYPSLRMVGIEWGNSDTLMSNIVTENVSGNLSSGTNEIKSENGIVRINES